MASAASEKQIAKGRAKAAADRVTDKIVITTLMSTVDGRRWLWLRLAECNIFHGDEDLSPQNLAYRAGQRQVGLTLLASVTRNAPDMYVRMTQENSGVDLTAAQEESSDD